MGTDTEFGPALRGGTPRSRRAADSGRGRPPAGPQRPRRRGRKVAVTALVVLAVLLAIPVALLLTVNARIEKIPVESLASGGSPVNVLLVGSDSREGMSREEQRELTTGSQGGNLTDTILLASMRGSRAALLSFPRDLYVTRCDGSQGRINAAAGIGGPDCLVDTVQSLSGIPVHHYMEIRFTGFRDVVDALGGVEMCLDQPIRDAKAGIDLPEGCQNLEGADALGYVRTRKIDNDLGRIERQQEFLQAVASEATEPSTALNVPRMFRVAGAGGDALRASDSVGPFSLARIGWGLRGLAQGAPAHTVPAEPASIGGAAVLEPLTAEAEPLFASFRSGEILGEEASAEDRVSPEDVTVTVLNGAGVNGLAGRVSQQLEARGYQIAEIGNAEPTAETVVRYPAGEEDAAELVAGEVPGDGVPTEEADVDTVTVVLGDDADF